MHLLSEYDSYRSSHIFAANDKPLSFFVSFYDIPQISKKIESSARTIARKVLYQKSKKVTRTLENYMDHYLHSCLMKRRLMKLKSISALCCLVFMNNSCTSRTELFRKFPVKSDNFDGFCHKLTFKILNRIEFTRNKLFEKLIEI